MKTILLFGTASCSLCTEWKDKLVAAGVPFTFYDVTTAEGLAEMAYRGGIDMPALVIGDIKYQQVRPGKFTIAELQALAKED